MGAGWAYLDMSASNVVLTLLTIVLLYLGLALIAFGLSLLVVNITIFGVGVSDVAFFPVASLLFGALFIALGLGVRDKL